MKKAEFTLSGFIIALIVIAMLATTYGLFMGGMSAEYGNAGANDTFDKYSAYTAELINATEDIRDDVNIEQDTGILDVIGGFFSKGYAVIRTAALSFNIFDNMLNDAAADIPYFAMFKTYLLAIIAIALFIGVLAAVLVKMRI